MIKVFRFLLPIFCVSLFASCATQKTIDIPYLSKSKALVKSIPELNVYQPRKSQKNPVVIFIHGGYWDEGDKDTYGFLGRNFGKKGIVTVVPNYTLSPNGNYNTMALELVAAIQWTRNNIEQYNGDPKQIFLMGHSAGGHIVSLVGTNPKYIEGRNMIKGVILNDAAGLDMYTYFKQNPPTQDHHYYVTWTKNEENWKDASPIYFLSADVPPFYIYAGTKSYPVILAGNELFVKKLNEYQPTVEINYLNKKHVGMMSQFIFPWNKRYNEVIKFIDSQK